MTRIDPIEFEGEKIVPIQFLQGAAARSGVARRGLHRQDVDRLPRAKASRTAKPRSATSSTTSATTPRRTRKSRAQAISYTTGVPAVTGAVMMVTGKWKGAGVFNMEQLPSEPFLDEVARQGLPWHVQELRGSRSPGITCQLIVSRPRTSSR